MKIFHPCWKFLIHKLFPLRSNRIWVSNTTHVLISSLRFVIFRCYNYCHWHFTQCNNSKIKRAIYLICTSILCRRCAHYKKWDCIKVLGVQLTYLGYIYLTLFCSLNMFFMTGSFKIFFKCSMHFKSILFTCLIILQKNEKISFMMKTGFFQSYR